MHEQAIIQSVIDSIRQSLASQKLTGKVKSIALKIGALELHGEESFKQIFAVSATGPSSKALSFPSPWSRPASSAGAAMKVRLARAWTITPTCPSRNARSAARSAGSAGAGAWKASIWKSKNRRPRSPAGLRRPTSPDLGSNLRKSERLTEHVESLRACRLCPKMHPPVVSGGPVVSKVLLVGQAPGDKEPKLGRPFAWTAGKTLFKWFFEAAGLSEERFRSSIYMAAVCRCFPGKKPGGGDRVPSPDEIENCAVWLEREIEILRPELVIPVGKLAIVAVPADGQARRARSGVSSKSEISTSSLCRTLPAPRRGTAWSRARPCCVGRWA